MSGTDPPPSPPPAPYNITPAGRARYTKQEGTKEIEILPSSAHYQTSQTSRRSNYPPHTHHDMSPSNLNPSKSNPQSRREAGNSESSNSSKDASSVLSISTSTSLSTSATRTTTSVPPSSSSSHISPESIELGIDPATLLHARTIENPSLQQLRNCIEEVKDQFGSPTPPASQYILATQISENLFKELEQEPDLFKGVRATILHRKRQVFYKVMVGVQHEVLNGTFTLWLNMALMEMHLSVFSQDYWFQQAARVEGRVVSKEPDVSFVPGNRFAKGASAVWPSLVLEVGVSESILQLRADAHWWYSNSDGQTKLVILIHTTDNAGKWHADVEIWSEVENTQPRMDTRGRPDKVLNRTQHACLENGVVCGAPLKLEFKTFMRRPPQNEYEKDVELTSEAIKEICGKMG
ncbi:hypothetical protein N7532_002571 [Penicillium argentinense]|uniref:Uncharacterized protein n=1 Tax=Penicillium argentinense TaxID=1131581 RepID=A0A9W9G0T5_9EURO|nr:uncharacterized protein N7532_002571 [Penicillium argentinense]KAJ5109926.1 hypothetical protein N7532_002571 [Penicillium argentinense]